ncbi:hypothetical protein QBC39DRAFT_341949 [Podospora conica]|nr:hypothetical protein QBC39DRAFT_341949 [Schizothecium conicum]
MDTPVRRAVPNQPSQARIRTGWLALTLIGTPAGIESRDPKNPGTSWSLQRSHCRGGGIRTPWTGPARRWRRQCLAWGTQVRWSLASPLDTGTPVSSTKAFKKGVPCLAPLLSPISTGHATAGQDPSLLTGPSPQSTTSRCGACLPSTETLRDVHLCIPSLAFRLWQVRVLPTHGPTPIPDPSSAESNLQPRVQAIYFQTGVEA